MLVLKYHHTVTTSPFCGMINSDALYEPDPQPQLLVSTSSAHLRLTLNLHKLCRSIDGKPLQRFTNNHVMVRSVVSHSLTVTGHKIQIPPNAFPVVRVLEMLQPYNGSSVRPSREHTANHRQLRFYWLRSSSIRSRMLRHRQSLKEWFLTS